MSSDWTAFDMATALRIAVAARPGIADLTDPEVRVISYSPSKDEQFPDAIIIGYLAEDADDEERTTVGGDTFEEVVDLICHIRATRPGAGQEVADEARSRVKLLLGELEAEVRYNLPKVGVQSRSGKLIRRSVGVMAEVREGVGTLKAFSDFSIRYTARTTSPEAP